MAEKKPSPGASSKPKPEPGRDGAISETRITLRVIEQNGNFIVFQMNENGKLKKLKEAYCRRAKLESATVRFMFDGEPVQDDLTPKLMNMEDEDSIEVFQEQKGGEYSAWC